MIPIEKFHNGAAGVHTVLTTFQVGGHTLAEHVKGVGATETAAWLDLTALHVDGVTWGRPSSVSDNFTAHDKIFQALFDAGINEAFHVSVDPQGVRVTFDAASNQHKEGLAEFVKKLREHLGK